jgi:hypothetical protein
MGKMVKKVFGKLKAIEVSVEEGSGLWQEGLGDQTCWRLGELRGSLWLWSSSQSGVCHKFFEELGSVEVLVIHPSVVSVGITYPMHQILQLLPSAEIPHV